MGPDRRLQKGLNPEEKSVRVKNFVDKLHYGIGLIAHSCGVRNPRELKRYHVRMVRSDGRSIPMDELYPPVAAPPREERPEPVGVSR